MQKIDIVYQHQDFIIIDKPCGISVHKDNNETGLTQLVAQQLGVSQVWLVHRLDKVTSGLLILARHSAAAAELSECFTEHTVRKTYLALSTHKPKKKQGLIIGDMQKSRNGAWKLCHSKENPAISRFHSVSCAANLRLFILQPQTGKTHQLRVAMKSLGSPILGDNLYGGEESDRVYLHAYALDFRYQGQPIHVQCPPKSGRQFLSFVVSSQIANLSKDD